MVKLQNLLNRKFLHSNIFGKAWSSENNKNNLLNSWIVEPVDGNWFYLRNEATDLYLDGPVTGKVYTNLRYYVNPAQKWRYVNSRLINKATGYALEVDKNHNLITAKISNNKSQLWSPAV